MPRHKSSFKEEFFSRPTLEVAPQVLGSFLCRRGASGKQKRAMIIEVEAYTQDDPACHAYRGLTERCRVMFGPAGRSYVYFIYGMYNCLNIVTEPEGTAGAILIRALDFEGAEGPGKLCKAFNIDRTHNGLNLLDSESELWLEKAEPLAAGEIGCSIRVGISTAQENPWRFFVLDHPRLSVRTVRPHRPAKRSGAGK